MHNYTIIHLPEHLCFWILFVPAHAEEDSDAIMVSYAKVDNEDELEPCEETIDWSMTRWSCQHLQNILEANGTLDSSNHTVRDHLLRHLAGWPLSTTSSQRSTSDVLSALCRAVRRHVKGMGIRRNGSFWAHPSF